MSLFTEGMSNEEIEAMIQEYRNILGEGSANADSWSNDEIINFEYEISADIDALRDYNFLINATPLEREGEYDIHNVDGFRTVSEYRRQLISMCNELFNIRAAREKKRTEELGILGH